MDEYATAPVTLLPPRTLGLRDIVLLPSSPTPAPAIENPNAMDIESVETTEEARLLSALARAVAAEADRGGVEALELSYHTLPSLPAVPSPSIGPVFRALALAKGLRRLDLSTDVGSGEGAGSGFLSLEEDVREVSHLSHARMRSVYMFAIDEWRQGRRPTHIPAHLPPTKHEQLNAQLFAALCHNGSLRSLRLDHACRFFSSISPASASGAASEGEGEAALRLLARALLQVHVHAQTAQLSSLDSHAVYNDLLEGAMANSVVSFVLYTRMCVRCGRTRGRVWRS